MASAPESYADRGKGYVDMSRVNSKDPNQSMNPIDLLCVCRLLKSFNIMCANSKGSDQTAYPHSLFLAFQRLRTDYAGMQFAYALSTVVPNRATLKYNYSFSSIQKQLTNRAAQ